jgi:hypothetical protein
MGGLTKFQRTGVYPDYIIFYSALLEKKWKKQIEDEHFHGKLYFNRKPIIQIDLTNDILKLKSLIDDGAEWIEKEYSQIMFD